MNPLVSIIIPVYNREKRIAETIHSALAQTWPAVEVLVIDDGSDDATVTVVQSINDHRVSLFQSPHQGAAAARNRGLREAKGEYIQFLDSDDLLNPQKIEAQVQLLSNLPGYLAICSTVHFYDGESWSGKQPEAYEEQFMGNYADPVQFLVKLWGGQDENGSMISSNAWLTPREVAVKAGYWDESLSIDDDGEYFTRVVLSASGIVYSSSSLNYYRKYRGNSLSHLNSEAKFSSILTAAIARKNALLLRTGDERAKLAVHKMLMNIVVKSYPQYPLIYRAALKELPLNMIRYNLYIGGPFTNTLSRWFGWKTARLLQYFKSGV